MPETTRASDLARYSADNAHCAKCGYSNTDHATIDHPGHPAILTHYIRRPESGESKVEGRMVVVQNGEAVETSEVSPMQALALLKAIGVPIPDDDDDDERWDFVGILPGEDALLRRCTRCGYIWAEACLDDPRLLIETSR